MNRLSIFITLAISYIFGLLVAASNWPGNLIFFILGLIYVIFNFIYYSQQKMKLFSFLPFIFLLLALLIYTHYFEANYNSDPLILHDSPNIILSGRIIAHSKNSSGKYNITLDKIKVHQDGNKLISRGKVELSLFNNVELPLGSIIQVEGELNIPAGQRNPGGIDFKRILLAQGIYARLYPGNNRLKVIGKEESIILYCREKLSKQLTDNIPDPYGKLAGAFIFGFKDDLPANISEGFTDAGLNHLLAVSGLHVSFVVLLFWFFLSFLPLPQWSKYVFFSILLIFYIVLTGYNAPVVRAGLLTLFSIWSEMLGKRNLPLNNLGFSILLLLIINPYQLWTAGFQLSYTVTAYLLFGYDILPRQTSWLKKTIYVSFLASLAAAPLTATYFYTVNPLNILSSIWAMPFVAAIIITGITGLLPFLGKLILYYITYPIIYVFMLIINIWRQLPGAKISVAPPSLEWLLFFYLLLFSLIYYFKPTLIPDWHKLKKIRLIKVLALAIAFIVLLKAGGIFFKGNKGYFVFLDVGQGDAIHIKLPNGQNILVDGGGTKGAGGDWVGQQIILPYLYSQGIKKIDAMFVSHFHEDHYKGLLPVLENMPVSFVAGPPLADTSLEAEFLSVLKRKNINYSTVKKGFMFSDGEDTSIKIFHPEFKTDSPNNNSLVIQLSFWEWTVLLTGDIEKEAENKLLKEKVNLESHILKVPHHGSKTSSTKEFVEAVKPIVAIISVGKNSYGHPSPETINTLNQMGIPILSTQENGAITIIIKPDKYIIKTFIN